MTETEPHRDHDVFTAIVAFLDRAGARFRVIEHGAEGRSEAVAALRGTEIGQGAKALVCDVIGGAPAAAQVLAVLSGADKADLKAVGRHFGGRKAQFSAAEAVLAATGCVTGTVPPFTLDRRLPLVADAGFLGRYAEIAFNAGRLDRSIVLATADYVRLFEPVPLAFAKPG